jgi:23S rRNA (cytosine1962-C5)-methyltransferase
VAAVRAAWRARQAALSPERLVVERQGAFAALDALAVDEQRFDLVIADPPAFAKNKRELKLGLRGYRKLARSCVVLVAEAGFLVIARCSHNVPAEAFLDEVQRGAGDSDALAPRPADQARDSDGSRLGRRDREAFRRRQLLRPL